MGDADGAQQAFQRLLVIAPDSKLRDAVSPKIRSDYEASAAGPGDTRRRSE